MSNIQDSSRLEPKSFAEIEVDIQAHGLDGTLSLPAGAIELIGAAIRTTFLDQQMSTGEVDVAIVNDATIQRLNRDHLQHDWETDVISFSYHRDEQRACGELIVSWETARRQAAITQWPPLTELLLYCIHGTLHLLGLDDQTESQRASMRCAEQRVLQRLSAEGWQRYDVHDRGDSLCGPSNQLPVP